MAEAFAALGIAANIAQFICYGLQLVTKGKQAYDSLHGAPDEYRELEIIIQDAKNLAKELKMDSSPYSSSAPRLPSDQKAIRQLAAECQPLADTLLRILEDLKVSKDARFRGIDTVKQTVRSAMKKKDIQELKQRLLDLDKRLRLRTWSMLQK
jgi:molecular chaperone GrpE (heat shock protein)